MKAFDRRRLLTLLPCAALGTHLEAQTFFRRRQKPRPPGTPQFVYFGTDTTIGAAKGIYVARFDELKGQFTTPMLAAECVKPTFLAVNRDAKRRLIYAVNEGDARASAVSTYLVGPGGGLRLIGQAPSGGAGPCYVSLDATERFAYVANYNGGTVGVLRVQADGTLSPPQQVVDFHGRPFGPHGPNTHRQEGPHPHSAMLGPENRFLLVNDLGLDTIAIFPIDPQSGRLGTPALTETRVPGSGPRHLDFHPNGRWAYAVDELTNRIDCYLWNTTRGLNSTGPQGFLTDMGRSVDTLDPGFHGPNTAAEIEVSPNGYHLYVSNRGENSLVVFAIDPATGSLKLVQRKSCGGSNPRHFKIDPTGKWLVCGNQDSASITVFARDESSGQLTGPVQTLPLDGPQFTLFL